MSQLDPQIPSLRTFSEGLARILGTTSDTLYERQRSLVRAGLLKLEGRGRGGGTKASPRNVALLLLAYMISDSPTDAGKRVKKLMPGKSVVLTCPITGTATLLDALTMLLTEVHPNFAECWPEWVSVGRGATLFAEIEWPHMQCDYTPDGKYGSLLQEPFRIKGSLHGPTALNAIRKLIVSQSEGKQ